MWIVEESVGQYDSAYTSTVGVYSTEESARSAREFLENKVTQAVEEGTHDFYNGPNGYEVYEIPLDADPEDL